ncbi:MAG TPA: FHA domain-containing protein [Gemmataceae bacterium]|jgi:pSer/pThr/pTyr-binding forkhead associated (FHA) protein
MELNPIAPPEPLEDPLPASSGELVVRNGRLRGTRRALASALTLIGRDPACEFHVNVEGVSPLHCAVVHGPAGFLLRDLGSVGGTFLNGDAIQEAPLQHGDLIAVGPFEFRIHLPDSEESNEPLTAASLQTERDALRIQAAAVAAQQASLAEEESQLQQRRKALQRQKEQLAAHLDERRQQLLDLREQIRQDRAALKAETEAARQQNEEVRVALTTERETVQKELQQAGKERRRLIELRKRLKKRWRRHWHVHEAALRLREQELQAEQAKREQDTEALQRERVKLTQSQLRFNGEVELGRRQLQDEWQQLGLAQQQWEACLNQEQAERTMRLRELDRRAETLATADRALAEQRQLAEQLQINLRKETEGLDTRIRNQRLKLLEQEKQLSQPRADVAESPPPVETSMPAPVIHRRQPEVPRVLARLADDLTDQRRHLLEQWQRLLEVLEAWDPERAAIVVQFETAARELVQHEQRIADREQVLAAGEADLRRRQHALFEVRCSLEAWQARLTARETFLDNARVMLLADVRAREEVAEAQVQRLEEMRQRRIRRRSQEIEELRVARAQHEQMRRDYALLWQECQERRAELIREHRELSAKALALEQFRQELLRRAADTPGADKRLERLRRRDLARIQAEEGDLRRERAALMGETKRLDQRDARLMEQEETLVARHEEWMRQVAEWEDQQAASADLEQHRQQELQHWRLVHEQNERQLTELREEVERIARLLLDETEVTTVTPTNQAA